MRSEIRLSNDESKANYISVMSAQAESVMSLHLIQNHGIEVIEFPSLHVIELD